jgi:hypothetical protein
MGDRMNTKCLISDEMIDWVWCGNFGNSDRREIIRDTLAKLSADFGTGSTSILICKKLKLVLPSGKISKLGRRYLYYANEELKK